MVAKKRAGVKMPGRRLAEAGWAGGEVVEVGAHGRALCRWCRMEILAKRRRTFCSDYCVHQWRLRSDPGYLRDQVLLRDKGVCALCGTDTVAEYARLLRSRGKVRAELLEVWGMRSVGASLPAGKKGSAGRAARRSLWDADHVRPVAEGGGECDLDNLRTLCLCCHREVTADLRRRLKSGF
ncbi:MAG TPA: HNH endonuclease signature motif containing protein [Acidobacteriaceae bacterium]|nr:HNH endonuclease signature motif containing protein [Acidobacteriaceae bacterium]